MLNNNTQERQWKQLEQTMNTSTEVQKTFLSPQKEVKSVGPARYWLDAIYTEL